MIRRIVLGLLATAVIGTGAAPAAAAPSGDEFTITCAELPEDITVVLGPGMGAWAPAFVVDTNERVIPYELSGVFVTPTGRIVTVDEAKNPPQNGRHYVDCSFEQGGFGGLTGDVSVSFTLTPG